MCSPLISLTLLLNCLHFHASPAAFSVASRLARFTSRGIEEGGQRDRKGARYSEGLETKEAKLIYQTITLSIVLRSYSSMSLACSVQTFAACCSSTLATLRSSSRAPCSLDT